MMDSRGAIRLIRRRWPGWAGIAVVAVPLAGSTALLADWSHDNSIIRRQAAAITTNLTSDSARIVAVNHWVYHNQGFGKNSSYFIVPALGPTPLQVLRHGGDCADKSRLVAAMLNELGIDAGLVMIAPCLRCDFIHTVVEARYEGGPMVVDPIWDIDYPAGDGRYLGVRDLVWTTRGEERVVELQRQRGETDKIARMPVTEARFEYAVAVNWNKNIYTRRIAQAMRLLGYQPEAMFRPRLLEDPKLVLSWFLIVVAIVTIAANVLFHRIYRVLLLKRSRDDRNAGEITAS
jgi:hypothetical protein